MIYVFEHGEATRLTVLEMGRRGFPIYVLDVLSSIEDLADFYLTGSRYFGTQTKFSDVDLLTREDISLRKSIFVSSNDWIRKSSNYDSVDNGIVCTLRHQKGVDIQLCVDLETRKRAAAFLKASSRNVRIPPFLAASRITLADSFL